MTSLGPGAAGLGELRAFCLHEQAPAEARAMALAGRSLRRARLAARLSRCELAARLSVPVDVVIAVENGYGRLSAVQSLLARALQLASSAR